MIIQIQRLICCKRRLKAFDLKFLTFYFNLCVQTWSQGIQVVPMRKSHFTWKMISRHWAINRITFVADKESHKGKCNCLKSRLKQKFSGLVVSDMTFMEQIYWWAQCLLAWYHEKLTSSHQISSQKSIFKIYGCILRFYDCRLIYDVCSEFSNNMQGAGTQTQKTYYFLIIFHQNTERYEGGIEIMLHLDRSLTCLSSFSHPALPSAHGGMS